ncbi:MAG: xanthine permease [Brevinema sp.]
MSKQQKTTPYFETGDISGFFGLFTNSLTNLLAAIGLFAFAIQMPTEIVFGKIAPALLLAVGLGNIYLAWMAKRLADSTGHTFVTAMPYGVSVPHYFIVSFGIMLPIFLQTKDWEIAWSVGIVWNLLQGIIMLIGAFIGPFIQKYIPRQALLASLAGIAITYISMGPFGQVFTTPYIGLLCFAIVVVGWLAGKSFGKIPSGLLTIIVGTTLAWATGYMDIEAFKESVSNINPAFPTLIPLKYFTMGFELLGPFVAAAIPLAIYDFLESLDNVESAAVSGEHYHPVEALSVPAILTIISCFFGNVVPTIIYIGHPGWKATGARIGYSWMTGITILVLGFLGVMQVISSSISLIALLPILVYIGSVIGQQAMAETKSRHYPAVIVSIMPFIADYMILQIKNALGALDVAITPEVIDQLAKIGIPFIGWQNAGAANILVSMMLCSIMIFAIDKDFKKAAIYSLVSGALAYFGLMHSTVIGIGVGLPITLGYVMMAAVFIFSFFYKKKENIILKD